MPERPISDAEARDAVETFLRSLDDRIAGRVGTHSAESRKSLAAMRPMLRLKLRSDPEAWGRRIIDDVEAVFTMADRGIAGEG